MKKLNEEFKRHTKDLIKENDGNQNSDLKQILNMIKSGDRSFIELAFQLADSQGLRSELDKILKELEPLVPNPNYFGKKQLTDKNWVDFFMLRKIKIENEKIGWLSEHINLLTNLEFLELKNVGLKSLPNNIGQLRKLKELDLDNNNITSLPESIGQLKNLKRLFLERNDLTSLPESIGQLKNLMHLNLQKNNITSLPESIGQLKNLKWFFIYKNALTSLPESIKELKNLYQINLEENPVWSDELSKKMQKWFPKLI